MFNSLKESSEECTEPVFFCNAPEKDAIVFVFRCRGEEWLRAEGLMRQRRRKRGEPEPDLKVTPLPKPEPTEEAVPANEVLTGGAEVMRRRTPRPTGQGESDTPHDLIVLERSRKIPRRSGNSSLHQSSAEGSSGPKMKVEEDNVKIEDLKVCDNLTRIMLFLPLICVPGGGRGAGRANLQARKEEGKSSGENGHFPGPKNWE